MISPQRRREATIIGAAALAVTDRAARAAAAVDGADALSPSAVAALEAMRHFLVDPTLEQLRSVLGLTHSGAVRLVDRLCDAGLAQRVPGPDARSRVVRLTLAGEERASSIELARTSAVDALARGLSAAERATLVDLLSTVLGNVVATKDVGAWTCRLCDIHACGRPAGRCPAANAASRRFGSAADPGRDAADS